MTNSLQQLRSALNGSVLGQSNVIDDVLTAFLAKGRVSTECAMV